VQRKVFRIEQMVEADRASRLGRQHDDVSKSHGPEIGPVITRELAAIRSSLECNVRELAVLINDGKDRRMTRAAGDLGAAIEGMETATQKILASAEAIDDCARALASALSNDYHHGLTQDVQDHVVRIYEACNFQDLAGQRIGKVIAILMMIEDRRVAMIARHNGSEEQPVRHGETSGERFVNGPRLDGESSHASQGDIDVMFA
jgi:chemotaxis protein CheZ